MNQSPSSDSPLDPSALPPTFAILPLSPELRRALDQLGFQSPTPVQTAVFEPAAEGRDLVVQARTGTGKTAAFGLPLLDRLVKKGEKTAQALILSPTRELALQITRELGRLGQFLPISHVAIYGGAAMEPQVRALSEGAQIIVGTPGRVLDHLERGTLDPTHLRIVILDESDEMLSMGFLPQINAILDHLPTPRQTLLFSATVPPDVKRIAESRLKNPEFITLSGDHIGALSIEHYTYPSRGNKAEELVQIIAAEKPESAIVFCNTREQTKRIAAALQAQGLAADWLNADLSQADRERVMSATRSEQLRFLVATDVAARGIDISHLTHVINADFPESAENYVHRTGRTGRAGKTGRALSLIAPQDVGNLYILRLTYKIFPVERALPTQEELRARAEVERLKELERGLEGARFSAGELTFARRLIASERAEELVMALLRGESLSAGPVAREAAPATKATERTERTENKASKLSRKRDERRRKPERIEPVLVEPEAVRFSIEGSESAEPREADDEDAPARVKLFVSSGKRDGVRAEEWVNVLLGAGLSENDVVSVKVKEKHSFVSVRPELAEQALAALNGAEVLGRRVRAETARPRVEAESFSG